eukprot:975408-Pelagomonas_calceolata.AAC.1
MFAGHLRVPLWNPAEVCGPIRAFNLLSNLMRTPSNNRGCEEEENQVRASCRGVAGGAHKKPRPRLQTCYHISQYCGALQPCACLKATMHCGAQRASTSQSVT